MKKIKVSVVMITYNHEKYIKQAIEGVLIQETDFDIELIISNDASTDKTDEIIENCIKDYQGNITIKYHNQKNNKGALQNWTWTLEQVKGKYIAICEGDDYWTDPLKLQKQVDFLEANEDYGLVATQKSNFIELTKELISPIHSKENYKSYDFKDFFIDNPVATLTVLVKKILIDKWLYFYKDANISGFDYGIWFYLSQFQNIAILNDNTAVYRVLPNSASHSTDINKIWEIRKLFYNDFKFIVTYFNTDQRLVKKAILFRIKTYYRIVGRTNDTKSQNEIKDIFLSEKDYIRYLLFLLIINQPKFYIFANIYEKLYNILYKYLKSARVFVARS